MIISRLLPSKADIAMMDENRVQVVAQMLDNASNILRGTASTVNQQLPQASGCNPQALRSNGNSEDATATSSVQRALNHARNMIRNSSASGTYRRLGRSERLRTSSPLNSRSRNQEKQSKKKKAIEFALLKCFGDISDEEEEYTLKRDSIIASGEL